jgi:hypothetical protein
MFDPWKRQGREFVFAPASRSALVPTQIPNQWVLGALSLGVKRPGSEADHSSPSSAQVKNAYVFTARCSIKQMNVHDVVLS